MEYTVSISTELDGKTITQVLMKAQHGECGSGAGSGGNGGNGKDKDDSKKSSKKNKKGDD